MNRARTAAFLLAAASLGSLIAAAVTASVPVVLASITVLAVSAASFRVLGLREKREVRDRIEALGQPYRDVLAMVSCGVVRRAYVRGMDLAGEGDVAA